MRGGAIALRARNQGRQDAWQQAHCAPRPRSLARRNHSTIGSASKLTCACRCCSPAGRLHHIATAPVAAAGAPQLSSTGIAAAAAAAPCARRAELLLLQQQQRRAAATAWCCSPSPRQGSLVPPSLLLVLYDNSDTSANRRFWAAAAPVGPVGRTQQFCDQRAGRMQLNMHR